MTVLAAALVVVAFAVLIERMHVAAEAREVANLAADALAVLRDPHIGDDTKEQALRRTSLRLFGLSGRIVALSLSALFLPVGAVWVLDAAGLMRLSDVLGILGRLDFLLAATVVGTASYFVSRVVARR